MTILNLGFIRLGIMGATMAGHLRAAAHALYVHTRKKIPDALRDVAAISLVDTAEVAHRAHNIPAVLPDTPGVQREHCLLPCRKRQARRSS